MNKKEQVYQYISAAGTVVSQTEIASVLGRAGTEISGQYLALTLHQLLSESRIERVGRSRYQAASGELPRDVFRCDPGATEQMLYSILSEAFPGMSLCIWNAASVFYYLTDLVIPPKIVFIECERKRVDAVWRLLIGKMGGEVQFGRPPREVMQAAAGRESLVVVPSISDAPLDRELCPTSPRLEKILVDLLCDPRFSFLDDRLMRNIWRNACSDYIVNRDTLLRYASRRNKVRQAQDILDSMVLRPKRLPMFNDWISREQVPIPRWLLWDYNVDADYINWDNMKTLIAERVLIRGGDQEWLALLQRYDGKDNAAEIVKQIKVLPDKPCVKFAMCVLGIDRKDMLCLNREKPAWKN